MTHKWVPAPNKSRHQLAHLFNGALHLTWTVRQIAICFTHALYHPGEGISQRSIVLRFFFLLMHFLLTLGTRRHILCHSPPPKLNLCVSLCHWLQVPYCSHFQICFLSGVAASHYHENITFVFPIFSLSVVTSCGNRFHNAPSTSGTGSEARRLWGALRPWNKTRVSNRCPGGITKSCSDTLSPKGGTNKSSKGWTFLIWKLRIRQWLLSENTAGVILFSKQGL